MVVIVNLFISSDRGLMTSYYHLSAVILSIMHYFRDNATHLAYHNTQLSVRVVHNSCRSG